MQWLRSPWLYGQTGAYARTLLHSALASGASQPLWQALLRICSSCLVCELSSASARQAMLPLHSPYLVTFFLDLDGRVYSHTGQLVHLLGLPSVLLWGEESLTHSVGVGLSISLAFPAWLPLSWPGALPSLLGDPLI